MKEALKVFGVTVSIVSSVGSLVTFNDYSRALFMEKVFGIKETEKLTVIETEKLKHQVEKAELATKVAQLEAEQLKIKQQNEIETQQLREKKEKAEEEANQLRIIQQEQLQEQLEQKKTAPIEVPVEPVKKQEPVLDTAHLQQVAQEKLQTEQLKTKLEAEKKQVLQVEEQKKTDLSPKAIVEQLIFYASKNAGVNNENDISALTLKLDGFPKPPKGNIKEARKINEKGLLALQDMDEGAATQSFSEAQKLDPSDVEILNNLGFAYMKQENFDMAEKILMEVLILSPARSSAWSNLGDVFAFKENESKAIACYMNTYRFSKNKINTHKFMQKTNSEEDSPLLIDVREKAMILAAKTFPELKDEISLTKTEQSSPQKSATVTAPKSSPQALKSNPAKGDVETFVSGSKTFSYTKIANDGSELKKDAQLGSNPKDWACTKDNNTGLIWEVKTDDGGLRDKDNTYSWNNTFVSEVNNQGLCGKKDWRMPSIEELKGLLVENAEINPPTNEKLYINSKYFSNTIHNFWSSSLLTGSSNHAWFVNFYNGNSYYGNNDDYAYIRLVRGQLYKK